MPRRIALPDSDRTLPALDSCRRIALLGPSCAGKTTLARRLAARLDLPFVSLDRLYHLPGWQPRPAAQFQAMHDAAMARQDGWVMEGNYSATMPARLDMADLILFCDVPVIGCAWRFFWRSMASHGRQRPDAPDGCVERFSPHMYYHTLWDYPRRRRPRYHAALRPHAAKTHIFRSFAEIRRFSDVVATGGALPRPGA